MIQNETVLNTAKHIIITVEESRILACNKYNICDQI